MTAAPNKNVSIFHHLILPPTENSSTITSLAAMYMKVPPAKELKTISIISLASYKIIPIPTPIGAANAKNINKTTALLISRVVLKFLLRDTPREMASGDL